MHVPPADLKRKVADIENSNQWLQKAGTEAVIMAAQEQAPSTRAIDTGSVTPDRTPGAGCAKKPLRQSSTYVSLYLDIYTHTHIYKYITYKC